MSTPSPEKDYNTGIMNFSNDIARQAGTVPIWRPEQVVKHYTGRKRRKYERAFERIGVTANQKKSSYITGFIKPDKYNDRIYEKDPRMIQYRTPEYSAELAQYLKPMEKILYNIKGNGGKNELPNTPVIAKGLNHQQRAELLKEKLSKFKDPVILLGDATRFDAHCQEPKLKAEHNIYTKMNTSHRLKTLLKWQLRNKCRTKNGSKYKTVAKRMSGDMNTALGNCIIMLLTILWVYMNILIDFLIDGDDSLTIMERSDWEKYKDYIQTRWTRTGFIMKLTVVDRIEDIEFCKSKVVETQYGPKFCVYPWHVISHNTVGTRPRHGCYWLQRMRADALGLYSIYRGVPVLEEYALATLSATVGSKIANIEGEDPWYHYRLHPIYNYLKRVKDLNVERMRTEIEPNVRISFEQAFNIDPGTQMLIEQQLRLACRGYLHQVPVIKDKPFLHSEISESRIELKQYW